MMNRSRYYMQLMEHSVFLVEDIVIFRELFMFCGEANGNNLDLTADIHSMGPTCWPTRGPSMLTLFPKT